MEIVNIVEKLVWSKVDEVLDHKPEMCRCEKCRSDVAALALNKLAPRYVASKEGEVWARAAKELDREFEIEVVIALTEAAEIVAANPKHTREEK